MNKYIILAIVVVIVCFGHSFLLPTGGVYADSLSYFEIATDLPNPVTDLFPLGYPTFLRVFFEVFRDYFWAYKILNVSMLILVFVFSYTKKFFFRETVLLFMGKTLLFAFSIAISEGPFLFLMYFMFYFLYKILCTDSYSVKDVLASSFLMFLMFATRYSGIYVYLGIGLFTVFMIFKPHELQRFKSMLLFLFVAGLGIGGYLAFNYFSFGSFTGEDLRGKPHELLKIYIVRDILGTINSINPYLGLKPASNSYASIAFQFLMMLVDVGILIYFVKYFRKAKSAIDANFHILLWSIAGVYAVCLFVSGLVQQIEEMNTRMQAAVNVCLFFSFLIIYFKVNNLDKTIFRLSLFFFCFGVLYSSKRPENYFDNRSEIEPQISKFNSKKYMFNDERGENELTTYTIPFIEKSFQYRHTNAQVGDTKQSIVGTINPKIKWLKYDTVKTDKTKVLYTSEIILNQNRK